MQQNAAGQAQAQNSPLAAIAQAQQNQQGLMGQQMNQMQNAINNQIGQIIPYQGQTPQIVTSGYVSAGTAYILPNGTVITHPSALTPDQLEDIKNQWLAERKERFLKHPVRHREAFLQEMMASKVRNDMADPGMFGVNRTGYAQMSAGGLASWLPQQQPEITLEQYEEWHASSLIDSILQDESKS
jgi:hypothetical protein